MKNGRLMMRTGEYADRDYWNQYWEKEKREGKEEVSFYFSDLIEHSICWDGLKTYMEIGGAPGSVMAFMNKRYGLHVSAVDFTDKRRVAAFLHTHGVRDYRIYEEDFRVFDSESHTKEYDIVASWGFIEHFRRKVAAKFIEKQKIMVSDNGYLIVELPNIRRGMWLVYLLFNRNLIKIHNLKTMDLPWLIRQVLRGNKFKIVYASYYFTMNPQNEFFLKHKVLGNICKGYVKFFNRNHVSETIKRWFFPYIVIIARRVGEEKRTKQGEFRK
ncbi:MAG: methyltransferase domain-containing protein [Clostridium sp.]|jgi:2-polyprenyl-3-methyl-5-hydroxy-6-metoxy-1,4-benzoquinol methylase|nr:methyltransferase domain-containing protein [Clostridium sp.]